MSDTRNLTNYGKGLLSYAQGVLETQQFLRRLAQSPGVPAGADEILQVESIKENRSHTALICQVRRPNGRMARRAYFLDRNTENRELLLRQLERREGQGGAWEKTENRNSLGILLSLLVCCGFSALCVLSHPALSSFLAEHLFSLFGRGFCGAVPCCLVWNPAASWRVRLLFALFFQIALSECAASGRAPFPRICFMTSRKRCPLAAGVVQSPNPPDGNRAEPDTEHCSPW